jgi:hypothetical protein
MKLSKVKIHRLEQYIKMYEDVYNTDNDFHQKTNSMLFNPQTANTFLKSTIKIGHYQNLDKWMLRHMEEQYETYIKWKTNSNK